MKSENLNRNKAYKHLTKIVLILINKYTFSHKPKNHQLTKSRAIYSLKHYITGALFRINNWFVFGIFNHLYLEITFLWQVDWFSTIRYRELLIVLKC